MSRSLKLTGQRPNPIAAAVFAALAGASTAQAAVPSPGAAIGAPFRTNTYVTDTQGQAAVAMDATGDYVVVWKSYGQDGDSSGIYAQRYSASGARRGGEFRVNTYTTGTQQYPAVAMDAAGDFVVTWSSYQDGSGTGVYAQLYAANGAPQGGEFKVNTYTTLNQLMSKAAMDAAGEFVIVWTSDGEDGSANGVYAQRYLSDGSPWGGEFRVNTYTTSSQDAPAVAMDAAGDFIVTWSSYLQDGSLRGIYAQRYALNGAALGGEFRVNTTTSNDQTRSRVAMDAVGNAVVVWESQDGSSSGVYAQRYAYDGTPLGGEFRVNSATNGSQYKPAVAMDATGDFIVTWQGYATPSNDDVYAKRYAADGTVLRNDYLIGGLTLADVYPVVAVDAAGDAVVAWTRYGSTADIYAQRFAGENPIELSAGLAVSGGGSATVGSKLTVTLHATNWSSPSNFSGVAAVDNAIEAASGLKASLTLPLNTAFVSASGSHWTCPAKPVNRVLTCSYGLPLKASSLSPALTVTVKAPLTAGTATFTNSVAGIQPDGFLYNNTVALPIKIN